MVNTYDQLKKPVDKRISQTMSLNCLEREQEQKGEYRLKAKGCERKSKIKRARGEERKRQKREKRTRAGERKRERAREKQKDLGRD